MKNGEHKNSRSDLPKPNFWLKNPFGFMSEEARKVYLRKDDDGFSLASVQNLHAVRNWYEHRYGPDRETGLLGKALGGVKPLLTFSDLTEICGVDQVSTERRKCLLCEAMNITGKPFVLRYWSFVSAKGEIHRFGQFMWPIKFKGVKTLDDALCFCGLPESYAQNNDNQRVITHLFEARNAEVSVPRKCYDWATIVAIVTREEEKRQEAAKRAAREKQDRINAENKRQEDAQKNAQLTQERLHELLGI